LRLTLASRKTPRRIPAAAFFLRPLHTRTRPLPERTVTIEIPPPSRIPRQPSVANPAFFPGETPFIWRDPTWAFNDWFLYLILKRRGFDERAEWLRQSFARVVEIGGCANATTRTPAQATAR